jgi:hypothetical protein
MGVQIDNRIPINVEIVGITDCSSGTCYRPLFQYTGPDGNNLGIGGGTPAWYLEGATNLVIQNIDLTLASGASGYYSFIASCGNGGGAGSEALTNTLLRRMRIFNGEISNADGVVGCVFTRNNGYLWLDQMEMHNNGGVQSSYQHNMYINPSIDPTYTLKVTNSWVYNTCFGYNVKSRSRYLDLEGNYFQGGLAQSTCTPYLMGENANAQAANGGSIIFKNNILTRNDGSNLNGCYQGASGCQFPAMLVWNSEGFGGGGDGAPNGPVSVTSMTWSSANGGTAHVITGASSANSGTGTGLTPAYCPSDGVCEQNIYGITGPPGTNATAGNSNWKVRSVTSASDFILDMPGTAAQYCGADPCAFTGTINTVWAEAYDIENNTFVLFITIPTGSPLHNSALGADYPFVSWPPAEVPAAGQICKNNVFIGFSPGGVAGDYRCDSQGPALLAGFGDINQDFTLMNKYTTNVSSGVIGETEYCHEAAGGCTRQLPTIGAED